MSNSGFRRQIALRRRSHSQCACLTEDVCEAAVTNQECAAALWATTPSGRRLPLVIAADSFFGVLFSRSRR